MAAAQLMLKGGSACCAPCRYRRRTRSPACAAVRMRCTSLAGRRRLRRGHQRTGPAPAPGCSTAQPRHPAAARRRLHGLRRRAARAAASTARSPRRTPTAPHRCDASPTATSRRSASRCARACRCRSGSAAPLPLLPEEMAAPTTRRTPSTGRSSTSRRRRRCMHRVGEQFDRRGRGDQPQGRHPAARRSGRARKARRRDTRRSGSEITVRLEQADPQTRVGAVRLA